MIFKTTDDGGLTNIFKELKSVQIAFEELDKTTLRSAIKAFNNTSLSVDDLSEKFGGLDNSVVEYLNNTERGQASMDGLSNSIDKSTTSMISATAKAKILAVALNALTGLAITLTIKGITWAVDELIVTLDEQKEKLEEATNAYEESKSELEKINDELKTTTERIDELNGKENLTFTEQDELEKLIKTNDELERKIFLLEQANKEAEKEVANEAQKTYDKYVNNRTLGAVEQIDFYSDGTLLEGVNWEDFKGDLSWLIAQYKKQEEILLDAQNNGWKEIEDRAKSNLSLLEGYMSEASLDYQDLYTKISGISDYAMTDDLKVAKQDLDDILDVVAEILGYGGQRSNESFENIWNSKEFSKYKVELETIAKEGKLDADVLESNENYRRLLENTGATAEKTAQHINALVNEMLKTENQSKEEVAPLSITDTVNNINKKLKPALDSLVDTYTTLFSEEGYEWQPINVEEFASIKEQLDSLSEDFGINVPTEDYENFVKILSDSATTADQAQQAFDDLASSMINNSNVVELTDENFDVLRNSLENLGVANATEILEQMKEIHDNLSDAGIDLANVTIEEAEKFIYLSTATETAKEYLRGYMLEKYHSNQNPLNTLDDIKALEKECEALNITGQYLKTVLHLKTLYESAKHGGIGTELKDEIEIAKAELNDIYNNQYKYKVNFDGNLNKNGAGSSSKSAKDTAKTFDWIETLISRIQRNITNLGKLVSATYRNWSTRNNALAQEMAEVNKEINAQMTAYNAYMEKANKIDLDERYKKLVRDGDYSIAYSNNEKLNEKIDLYKEW